VFKILFVGEMSHTVNLLQMFMRNLQTDLALAIDAVHLFGETLRNMARRPMLPQTSSILCDAGDVWSDGELFNEALRSAVVPAQHTGSVQLAKGRGPALSRANSRLVGVTRTNGQFNEVGFFINSFFAIQ
jgi:hypothetical protein